MAGLKSNQSELVFFKANNNRTYQTKRKDDNNERYS